MHKTMVYAQQRHFTPLLCREIVWAIIEDGHKYFANILTKRDFDDAPKPSKGLALLRPHSGGASHTVPTHLTGDASTIILGITSASSQRAASRHNTPAGVQETDIHQGLKTLMTAHLQQNNYIML